MDTVWILVMLLVGTGGVSIDHLMMYTEVDCQAAVDKVNKVKPEKIWEEDAKLYVKCIPMEGIIN